MIRKTLLIGACTCCVLSNALAQDADKFKEAMQAAENAAKEKKYDLMLESYQNAAKLAPEKEKFNTQLKIAAALERSDSLRMKVEAVKAYGEALKLASNQDEKVNALIRLGKTQYAAGYPDDETALKTIRSIIDSPDSTATHKFDAYIAIADLSPSFESFEKLCRQALGLPGISQAQKITVYQRLIEKHRAYYGTRNLPAALKVLEEAIAREDLADKRISFMSQMGEVQQELRRFEEARQTFKKMMALPKASNNDIANAWMKIAGTYLADVKYMDVPSAKQYEEAIKCYQEILKLEKVDYSNAWLALAKAYFAMDDYENTAKYVQMIIGTPKINGNTLAQALCISGDMDAKKENYQSAFESYEKAFHIKDVSGENKITALDKLVTMAYALKNYDAAVKYLEELKKTPGRYSKRNSLDRYIETAGNIKAQSKE